MRLNKFSILCLVLLLIFIDIFMYAKAEAEICIIDTYQEIPIEYPAAIAASPDGNYLAVSNPDGIHLYNTDSLVDEMLIVPSPETSSGGNALSWSPDGAYLASFISSSVGIVIWDFEREAILTTIPIDNLDPVDSIQTIAWSPTGRYIAFTGNGLSVWIWDRIEGKVVFTESRAVMRFSYLSLPNLLAWHPSADILAYVSGLEIQFWNTQSGELLHLDVSSFTKDIAGIAWASDERMAINGGNSNPMIIFDYDNLAAEELITNQILLDYTHNANTLAWSPDPKFIATGGGAANTLQTQTGDIVIRESTNGDIVTILTGGHPNPILDIEWAVSGQVLFSWSHSEIPDNWILLKWEIPNECLSTIEY